MQGPALCVHNDSVFTDTDIESIQRLGVGSKSADPDKTGQFGEFIDGLRGSSCLGDVDIFTHA